MYLMPVIEEPCKMCKCVHVIYCIFWKTIKRLNGQWYSESPPPSLHAVVIITLGFYTQNHDAKSHASVTSVSVGCHLLSRDINIYHNFSFAILKNEIINFKLSYYFVVNLPLNY